MKAMIFAAGLGTRLKPFTDHHPKALATVHGKPLLQHNIDYLRKAGIQEIVINVHHFADQIIDYIQRNHIPDIYIADESNEVLETGGGLLHAAPLLQSTTPLVVMNVDILTQMDLPNMIAYHQLKKPLATLAVSERKSSRYFIFDEQLQLCGWKHTEKNQIKMSKQGTQNTIDLAFSGIQILDPNIFSFIQQRGKFSMVDVYLDLAAHHTIIGYNHTGSILLDVGKPESIELAEQLFGA